MRVITFNLRFENDHDGHNSWDNRRDLVIAIVKRYSPALLGTQEGKASQLRYIQEQLPDYHLHAPARIFDETTQYPTLFFQKAAFELLSGAEFWLSTTPEIHRSKDWDSAYPRMMSHAKVRSRASGRHFWAAVTHLDHVGSKARYEQARLIEEWVRTRKGPVILMGDFNDAPGSSTHRLLTSPRTGLLDTWMDLAPGERVETQTHHDFRGHPLGPRMDWVLATRDFCVTGGKIITDDFRGRYPSDHFPYMVDLRWRRK